MSIETIKIELNSVVMAVADQVSCDLEGEAAVLNLKTGVYYGLDEVGASVWRMLDGPRRVDELVDALLGEYEVDREECQRDVIALLGELAVRGLVEINNAVEG
ncbi:MAG TPA: PqqD family protein [Candidatus Binataceae bacterium]|nr:PqqD family protein [Candidatus Binataceae bacterium]